MGNELTADEKLLQQDESTSNAGADQHDASASPTPGYPKNLTNALNKLRKEDQLCDVVINMSGTPFHAHRAVLAASSNYFRAMFASGYNEAIDNEIKIDGNPEIFEELLEYAYTGMMKISPNTACALLQMGVYLQFPDILQHYFDIIQFNLFKLSGNSRLDSFHLCQLNEIPVDDMFEIYELSKCYWESIPEDLIFGTMKYFYCKLEHLRGSKEFLATDHHFLKMLLSCDDIACDEAEVLEMVVCWLKYNWHERCVHVSTLLGDVRLGVIAEEKLNQLMDAEIQKEPKCQELLQTLSEERKSSDSDAKRAYKNLAFSKRGTLSGPITLITKIKYRRRSDFWIEYYAKEINWARVPQLKGPGICKNLIQADNKLYAIGVYINCFDDFEDSIPYEPEFQECCEYDAEKNEWEPIESCKFTHKNYSTPMIHHNGYIYVFGGFDVGNDGEGVERYDLTQKCWEILCPLPELNVQCISAVVNQDGNILVYAVTKLDEDEDERIRLTLPQFMFEYNPSTNTWKGMNEVVGFMQCLAVPATIYEHHGKVYRILYRRSEYRNNLKQIHKPVVNVVEFSGLDEDRNVSIGEEICQDFIPSNRVGAFRIQDQVFVNACISGFVQETDIRISSDQTEDLEFDLLDVYKMNPLYDFCGITYFTLNKTLLRQDALDTAQFLDALEEDENLV